MAEGRRALVANLVAQLAFGLLSMTICLPSMQDWPALFNASQATVQLTFSGYVALYGGLQLVYGPLSDRVGRKPVLMIGLVLSGLGALLAALAPSLALLIAARVLQGAGNAAGMVMGRALVQDHFEGGERTRIMAWVGMTMGLVPPTATLLGGQLHVRLGWQANFVLLAVLAVVLFIAAWRGLPHTRPAQRAREDRAWLRELISGYAQLARQPSFTWYVLLLAATTATFYTFLGGAPIVLARYGVTPDRLGWYIMTPPIAYIVGNAITVRLIRKHSDYFVMVTGQVVTLASLLVVLALGFFGPQHPLALSLPLVLLGIGHGLLVPPSLSGTVGLVPALAGSAAAVAGVMQQLGGAIGGYSVGLVSHEGQVNLAGLMLFWSACGLAALLVLRARRR
jgi:DHA1 family bicyclomycin/chloramphenicol resistance-like MFS transporter